MTRKRDKIWTAIIATKQWFTKLFTSEADALVDDFGNNPPPEIETQLTRETYDKTIDKRRSRENLTNFRKS